MSDNNIKAKLSVGVAYSGDGSGLTAEQERQLNKIPMIEQSVEEITNDLNSKANTSDIPTNTSELYNDSGFLTSIPSEYVTETEMNEAIANVSSGGSLTSDQLVTLNKVPTIEQDVANLKTTLGDKNGLPSGDANVIASINKINNSIGVEELSTTAKTLKGAINEVFQDVDNGKTLIASAITDKGITTSNNDTFQTMADNISRINSIITDVNINSYKILKDNWKFKLLSNNGTDRPYTN